MTWGAEQDKVVKALIEFPTSPPILALPDWQATFQLHTDASELGAGLALTQDTRNRTRYRVCEPPLIKGGCQAVRD